MTHSAKPSAGQSALAAAGLTAGLAGIGAIMVWAGFGWLEHGESIYLSALAAGWALCF